MNSTPTTDRILDDLRRVVDDAESLLRETSGLVGERAAEARERAAESVRTARDRLSGLEQELLDRAKDAADDAEKYVRRNPWQSLGIAAGVGLIVGVLLSRR